MFTVKFHTWAVKINSVLIGCGKFSSKLVTIVKEDSDIVNIL